MLSLFIVIYCVSLVKEGLLDEAVSGHSLLGRPLLHIVPDFIRIFIAYDSQLKRQGLDSQQTECVKEEGEKGPPEHDVEPGVGDIALVEDKTVIYVQLVTKENQLVKA